MGQFQMDVPRVELARAVKTMVLALERARCLAPPESGLYGVVLGRVACPVSWPALFGDFSGWGWDVRLVYREPDAPMRRPRTARTTYFQSWVRTQPPTVEEVLDLMVARARLVVGRNHQEWCASMGLSASDAEVERRYRATRDEAHCLQLMLGRGVLETHQPWGAACPMLVSVDLYPRALEETILGAGAPEARL